LHLVGAASLRSRNSLSFIGLTSFDTKNWTHESNCPFRAFAFARRASSHSDRPRSPTSTGKPAAQAGGVDMITAI
jgi:hypothetical protein